MSPSAERRPSYLARIARIHDHAPDVRSCFLRCVGAPLPAFAPGMFISIAMPLANEVRVRPYTIASSPEARAEFEIVFNRVPGGPGSAWLFDRKLADEISFTGPFGTFTIDTPPAAPTAFIAEATAIAPIRPMLQRVLAAGPTHQVALLYAADRAEHLLYRPELESAAQRHPQFCFYPLIIPGPHDLLISALEAEIQTRWLSDPDRARRFYLCGTGPGILALRDRLRAAGFDRRQVRSEKW